MIRRLVLLALAAPVAAQQPAIFHGRSGQTNVRIPKVVAEPAIDGRLDDPAWSQAAILTGFLQYSPVGRQPADDSTEVRVIYADHAIYFGIRAFETHGPVAATLADRDRISSNDHVELYLDTFNDRRRSEPPTASW